MCLCEGGMRFIVLGKWTLHFIVLVKGGWMLHFIVLVKGGWMLHFIVLVKEGMDAALYCACEGGDGCCRFGPTRNENL